MIVNGASGISHCTISFGASNPEVEINEILEENKLVVLDLGASCYGYASDNRRYGYTGEVPAYLSDTYKMMCGIVNTVGDALAPGITGKELYALAQELYRKQGLEPSFRHVGHTMGLQTEEVWLDSQCDRKLEAGVVLNIELYHMLSTGENIGNEETYLIIETGNIRLTSLPQKIYQID
jgi:Xaa-Pro aminopeptidase